MTADDVALAASVRCLARLAPALEHDLKGPLNAIQLHLEVVRRIGAVVGESADGRRLERSIVTLRGELDRLERMIEAVFAMQVVPSPAVVDELRLDELVEEVVTWLVTHGRQRGCSVSTRVSAPCRPISQRPEPLRRLLLLLGVELLEIAEPGDSLYFDVESAAEAVVLDLELGRPVPVDRVIGRCRAIADGCSVELVSGQPDSGVAVRMRVPSLAAADAR